MITNRLAVLVGATVIAGACAAPALSQDRYRPTGTRISQGQERVDPNLARRLLKLTARCIYRSHADEAHQFLRNTDPVTADYADFGIPVEDLGDRLNFSQCLSEATQLEGTIGSMSTPPRAMRAALAEEAYLAANAGPMTIAPDAPEVLANRPIRASASELQARGLAAFADCLVFRAPAEADAVVRTSIGTDEERAAARALVPAISECLVEGQEANLTTGGIREMVADGLWSRSEYGATAPTGE